MFFILMTMMKVLKKECERFSTHMNTVSWVANGQMQALIMSIVYSALPLIQTKKNKA